MVKLYLIAPRKDGLLEGNPSSLLQLGIWVTRNSDFSVEIISDPNQIVETDVLVGISVTTSTYQTGLAIARTLKQNSPAIKTILGGYHTKGQSQFIAQHPEIDFIVEGQGETGLVQLLKEQKDKIVFGAPLTSEELDSVSIADLFKFNPNYFQTLRQFGRMNYLSTRGCPYACSFCASSGKLSTKSTETVVNDLETLAKMKFNQISIQDNYFGYSPQRIRAICNQILERRINLDWDCQTRVESLQDESLLRLMSKAGCSAAYLGTENFHSEVLKRMNKTKTPEDYLSMTSTAVKNLLVAGIKPYLNLQVGLSYETAEIRQTNLDTLRALGRIAQEHQTVIEIFPHLNVVYPGTPDFYALVNSGVPEDIFETFTDWEEENGQAIKDLLRRNHFIHGAGGIPLGILNFEKLKERKLELVESRVKVVGDYMDQIRTIAGIKIYQ